MKARVPGPAKLVVSLISADCALIITTLRRMEERFGPIDVLGALTGFTSTAYYADELGAVLKRRMASFERPIEQDALADVKLFTNGLEQEGARDGSRAINIDPGLLTLERFVLASCKNFSHRVYLGSGVFADLTLIYSKNKGFILLPWTYPDYAEPKMRAFLEGVRRRFSLQNKR